MHEHGHVGAALLAYAPLAFGVWTVGAPGLALLGAVGVAALATVPDWDLRVPLVPHRGPTHTVWFALLAGGALAGAALAAGDALPGGDALPAFGFAVGVVAVGSHVAADALTPMGVRPFAPFGRRYSLGVCRASNPLANYLLLGLGAFALAGAVWAARTVAPWP